MLEGILRMAHYPNNKLYLLFLIPGLLAIIGTYLYFADYLSGRSQQLFSGTSILLYAWNFIWHTVFALLAYASFRIGSRRESTAIISSVTLGSAYSLMTILIEKPFQIIKTISVIQLSAIYIAVLVILAVAMRFSQDKKA